MRDRARSDGVESSVQLVEPGARVSPQVFQELGPQVIEIGALQRIHRTQLRFCGALQIRPDARGEDTRLDWLRNIPVATRGERLLLVAGKGEGRKRYNDNVPVAGVAFNEPRH